MSPRARASFAALALCAGAALLRPAPARAFSDTSLFPLAAEMSGGGGRFFTGSPSDGFTCAVCHEGAPAPQLAIVGLPLAGYGLRTAYEVTVDWPDNLERVSLALEITDDFGVALGTLSMPAESALAEPERCAGTPISAGQLTAPPNRSVITMPDCGAKRLRFLWTTPDADRGRAHLAGAVVHADGLGTILGDGVTEIARTIGSPTSPNAPAVQIDGCSVTAAGARHRTRSIAVAVATAIFALCWAHQRKRRVR